MKTYQIGDKVHYRFPIMGSLVDRVIASKYLEHGKVYRIKNTITSSDGTHQRIQLRGCGPAWFNSDMFELKRNGTPEEIEKFQSRIVTKKRSSNDILSVLMSNPANKEWVEANRAFLPAV